MLALSLGVIQFQINHKSKCRLAGWREYQHEEGGSRVVLVSVRGRGEERAIVGWV